MNSESGQEIVRGRTETAEPAAAVSPYAPSASAPAGVEQTAGTAGAPGSQRRRTGGHASGIEPTGGAATHSGAVGDTVAGGGPAAGDSATGWERKELSISPPSLDTALSVLAWLILLLLGTMVGMVVLRTIWSCLASVWNAVKVLIP